MNKITYIYLLVLASILPACSEQEDELSSHTGEVKITASYPQVTTKGFGTTSYEATEFDNTDQIGIFVTKSHLEGDNTPMNLFDIFKNYYNVGYTKATNGTWNNKGNQPKIKMPMFPSAGDFDICAYYPWADLGDSPIITNIDDSENISFKLFQDQSGSKKNLCNVMRAIPIKKRSFSISDANSYNVNLQFEHILSMVEFHITADVNSGWNEGDTLLLDKVAVFGTKISTEGTFDIAGPTPNVRISQHVTSSNSSIYMADPNGSQVPDAYTGATPNGKNYLRRVVIIPPVSATSTEDPAPGETGEVELLVALRWKANGGAEYRYTNRHYIAKGVTFESGKKYIFNIQIKKHDPDQKKIVLRATSSANWDGEYAWDTTFD